MKNFLAGIVAGVLSLLLVLSLDIVERSSHLSPGLRLDVIPSAFAQANTPSTVTGLGISLAAPGPIGATTPSTGAFTSLTATSIPSAGAIGGTTPSTGAFTTVTASSGFTSTSGGLTMASTDSILFTSRAVVNAPSNADILLTNSSQNGFTTLFFGSATSSFPALTVSGTTLTLTKGDNSAGGILAASANQIVGGTTPTAGMTSMGTTVVASLPAAAAGNKGQVISVSDSTAVAAEGQTCAGSSTNTALAFSNGAVWKCF